MKRNLAEEKMKQKERNCSYKMPAQTVVKYYKIIFKWVEKLRD